MEKMKLLQKLILFLFKFLQENITITDGIFLNSENMLNTDLGIRSVKNEKPMTITVDSKKIRDGQTMGVISIWIEKTRLIILMKLKLFY